MRRQSISSSRDTSESGTAFGCGEPARNTSSDVKSSARASSLLSTSVRSACVTAVTRPSACAIPLGSMIMITEPSPRIVVPENAGMCRSFEDIGLMTISSVWKTPSTTAPKTWLPTCVTTMKPSSVGLAPRRSASFR